MEQKCIIKITASNLLKGATVRNYPLEGRYTYKNNVMTMGIENKLIASEIMNFIENPPVDAISIQFDMKTKKFDMRIKNMIHLQIFNVILLIIQRK